MLINTITPSITVFYGESAQDLALMPTTTTVGQGNYPKALASSGSYAIILESNGLKKYKLRSTGWVEIIDSGGGSITVDPVPTKDSSNAVSSNGVWSSLQEKQNTLTFDSTPTQNSSNPVTSNGVWGSLQNKQNKLTFDTTPTRNSNNPVTSNGVWEAIQESGGGGGDVSTDDLMQQSAYAMLNAGTASNSFSLSRSYAGLYPDYTWQYASGTPRVYTDLARFSNVYGENGLLYWLHNEYLTNTAYPNNNGQLDFIKIGDYFQFTTTENYRFTMRVAGIDTYWNMGNPSQGTGIGHHIDFISDELYPTAHIFTTNGTALGTSGTREPWLISDLYFWLNSLAGTTQSGTAVDYTASGVLNTLPAEITDNISSKISCLVQQTSLTPDDYSFKAMGKLWVPSEVEIFGRAIMGQNLHYQAGHIQYALFANNGCNLVKYTGGTAHRYWIQSYRDNSAQSLYIETDGTSYNAPSNTANIYAPICFRVEITNY